MRTRTFQTLVVFIIVAVVCIAATIPAYAAWDDRQLKIGDPQAILWLHPVNADWKSVYIPQPDGSRKKVTSQAVTRGTDVLARGMCASMDRRANEAEYRIDSVCWVVIPIPDSAWSPQQQGDRRLLTAKLLDYRIHTDELGPGPHLVEVLFKVNGRKWGSNTEIFWLTDDTYEDYMESAAKFGQGTAPKVTTDRTIRQLPGPPADLPELKSKPSSTSDPDPRRWPLTTPRTIQVPTRAMSRGETYVAVRNGKVLGTMVVVDPGNGLATLQAASGTIPDPEVQKFDLHRFRNTGNGGQAS